MKKIVYSVMTMACCGALLFPASALAVETADVTPAAETAQTEETASNQPWYAQAVAEVTKTGLMPVQEDGLFHPEKLVSKTDFVASLAKWGTVPEVEGDTLSRIEVVELLSNFLQENEVNLPALMYMPAPFDDADLIPEELENAVLTMRTTQLMGGYEDNTFRPAALMTRGEAAVILARLQDFLGAPALVLSLPGNASTGYAWQVVDYDETMLEVTALEYQQNEAEEGMVGVDGLYPFSIKGLKAGRTEITFQYCRSGETAGEATDEAHIVLYVDEDLQVFQVSR